jgi:hypothetical protein
LVTIASVCAVGVGVYVSLKEEIATQRSTYMEHERRIENIEAKLDGAVVSSRSAFEKFQGDIQNTLSTLRETVAALKAIEERRGISVPPER